MATVIGFWRDFWPYLALALVCGFICAILNLPFWLSCAGGALIGFCAPSSK